MGPLIFSPLSEIPVIGRNIPYLVTFGIFVIVCVPTGLVDNFGGLLVLRFLQGFFGSPALATGGASMQDLVRHQGIISFYSTASSKFPISCAFGLGLQQADLH